MEMVIDQEHERYFKGSGWHDGRIGIRVDMIRLWAGVYAHNPESPLAWWRQAQALESIEFYLTHPR